jgi:serine/threonine-protein kinase
MGAVYLAVDEALERPVAVKLIRDDLVSSVDLNNRFRHEARAAAGFAHPHVVRVYDFGVDRDARAFLVMELLEGQTLRQRLAPRAPLDHAEVLHILRGVCSAIGAAHEQGLVHRDLKPENIFLQQHEHGVLPKVLDFGLAKAFGAHWPHDRAKGTDAGVLVGTLEYMAPEQAAGDVVSPAWDIWALGVITHEMLTGRHPFRRHIDFGPDESVTTGLEGDLAAPALPEAVNALLSTALSAQQGPRPKGALDFLRAFEAVLS